MPPLFMRRRKPCSVCGNPAYTRITVIRVTKWWDIRPWLPAWLRCRPIWACNAHVAAIRTHYGLTRAIIPDE